MWYSAIAKVARDPIEDKTTEKIGEKEKQKSRWTPQLTVVPLLPVLNATLAAADAGLPLAATTFRHTVDQLPSRICHHPHPFLDQNSFPLLSYLFFTEPFSSLVQATKHGLLSPPPKSDTHTGIAHSAEWELALALLEGNISWYLPQCSTLISD